MLIFCGLIQIKAQSISFRYDPIVEIIPPICQIGEKI